MLSPLLTNVLLDEVDKELEKRGHAFARCAAGASGERASAAWTCAALDRPDIDAYGKRVALQPDMLLRADVILEKRTLISWLTNPLRSVRM